MSRISQDFIASVGSLYEEINIQQQDFLNEESEHYDAETAELVEEILATISTSMVYEGYSAEAIVGFLADSSEETIIEKYLSFDETILTESTVSEEYIVEQLNIFDTAINEGVGTLIGKAAAGVGKLLAKRAPALKSAGPLTQKAATRLAMKGKPTLVTKAKVGVERMIGPKGRKAVQAVKDFASKAKEALPKVAKGAGIFGLGAAGGFVGAKLAGAGSGTKAPEAAKPSPADTKPAEIKPPAAAKPAPSGAPASAKPKAPAKDANQQYKDLIKAGKTKEAEKLGLETWAKANPKLAAKLNPDGTQKGTGQSQMEKDAEELRKMQKASQMRQQGKDSTDALDAQQKKDKEKADKALKDAASSMKESYEPYDVLLEYLMSGGHADTIEEAHYIMLEMDAAAVQTVMEEYEDYLLAEKVSEWVDGLLDEGYDLSEHSWDDIVEYYVSKN